MKSVYIIRDLALLLVAVVLTICANKVYTVDLGTALLLAVGTDSGDTLVQEWLVIGSILDCLSVRWWNAAPVDYLMISATPTVFLLLLDFEKHLNLILGKERWFLDLWGLYSWQASDQLIKLLEHAFWAFTTRELWLLCLLCPALACLLAPGRHLPLLI